MTEHKFGGPWTQEKLNVLSKYLSFYTKALKKTPFSLVYIDGFAGTGECTIKKNGREETIAGSATIALNVSPPFDRYYLIEQKKKRFRLLEKCCGEYTHLDVRLSHADGNKKVIEICKTLRSKNRGVMFIDPYGMNVAWKTLQAISETRKIDLLLLFPYSGLYRQAARKMEKVDEDKAAAIDLILGTDEWRNTFYSEPKQLSMSMLGDTGHERHVNNEHMLTYFRKRLSSIFGYVAEPLILPKTGAPLFALMFAVSNDNQKAISLAKKVAKHILDST